jgi:ribosome-associated protein
LHFAIKNSWLFLRSLHTTHGLANTAQKLKALEANLPINNRIIIPGDELHVTVSRSSGPGGQHVNKTSSRVSLRWSIPTSSVLSDEERSVLLTRLASRLVGDGDILLHVESERSQQRNREVARERLAQLVGDALRPRKKRVATQPTRSSKAKRLKQKKLRSIVKKLRSNLGD